MFQFNYEEGARFISIWPDMLWFYILAYNMIYKWKKTKRNPYKGELYTDLKSYQKIKALAE